VIINPNTGALAGKPSKGKSGKFKIKVDGVTGGD
jgi:hypothetical protein